MNTLTQNNYSSPSAFKSSLNQSNLQSTNTTFYTPLNHKNQSMNSKKQKNSNDLPPSPVLLVCIYNKTGKIITHDYFYQNFAPYGEIVKILIFQKAKVWKTFVEFRTVEEAQRAKEKLNNKVVFQDGSKMNIFPAKLRSIELQNSNLGGVNYEKLSSQAQNQQEKHSYWTQPYQWQNYYGEQHGMISNHPDSTYLTSSGHGNNGQYNYENYNYNPNSQVNDPYNYGFNYQGAYQIQNNWQNDQDCPQIRNRSSTLGGTPNQKSQYKGKNLSSSFNKYYIHSPMVLHSSKFQDEQYPSPQVQGYQSSYNSISNQNPQINFKNCSFLKNQTENKNFSPQVNRLRISSQTQNKQQRFKKEVNQQKSQDLHINLFPGSKFNSNVKSSKFQWEKDIEQKSFHSLFCDADQQFRQLAQESKEYQEWKIASKETNKLKVSTTLNTSPKSPPKKEQNNLDQEEQIHNRRKSVTVNYLPHSHTEQFIQQNIPSKVLFIRSIPGYYTPQMIYNIFSNFGQVIRVIYMKNKMSSLIQYTQIEDAIQAKDELNYCKCEIRVFYSHYETLMNRYSENQQDDCQQFICQLKEKSCSQSSYIGGRQDKKKPTINPPSDTLYLTQLTPENQDQLYNLIQINNCKIVKIQWKQQKNTSSSSQNGSFSHSSSGNKNKKSSKNSQFKSIKDNKQKWMCLIQLRNINQSLFIMGVLQGYNFKNQKFNKQLKISFTRSKISGMGDIRGIKQRDSQIDCYSPQRSQKKYRQSQINQSIHQNLSPEKQSDLKIRNRWKTVSFNSVPECDQEQLEIMIRDRFDNFVYSDEKR